MYLSSNYYSAQEDSEEVGLECHRAAQRWNGAVSWRLRATSRKEKWGVRIPFAHHFTKHFEILNAFNPHAKRSCQVDIIIPILLMRKPVQGDLLDGTMG